MTTDRPKKPAPTTGWLIADLGRLTGVPVRTIRYYVGKGIIDPTELRGRSTRYPRRALLRLVGTVRLLGERLTLAEVKKRLDTLGNLELETWVRQHPIPDAVLAALEADAPGQGPPVGAPVAVKASPPSPFTATTQAPVEHRPRPAEVWHRLELLPGLSLQWPANADSVITETVRRIRQICPG